MNISEIAAIPYWKEEGAAAAADIVTEHLDRAEPKVSISTTTLLHQLKWNLDMGRSIFAHLSNARAQGLLAGYFTVGKPSAFTYGKPSYRWHAPEARKEMTKAEKKAWFKENAPEEYTKIYKD